MENKESAMTKLNNEAATVSGYNVPAIAIRDHVAQRIMSDAIYAEKVIAEGKTLSKCYQYISDIDENWFSDTKPHYSTDMTNFLQELYYEYYEWLYDCGSSIDMRVYLWAVGYEMAYTQLECEKTDKETE